MIGRLSPAEAPMPPEAAEIFTRFQQTEIKIAIQKDGELTEISREILANYFGVEVPAKNPDEKRLIEVSEDGRFGFVYARNKGICELVANGAVDIAVVGTDRLIEDGAEDRVEIVSSYEDQYAWPLVLATPQNTTASSIRDIKRIATQYPRTVRGYFAAEGITDIEIIPTVGSTELYPYLDYAGKVDAVVDMHITGKSLAAHNLAAWTPSIGNVYPVLIRAIGEQDA